MIRIILRTDNAGMAANVGGAVLTTYRTVDITEPTVEALLRDNGAGASLSHTQIVGAELIEVSPPPPKDKTL